MARLAFGFFLAGGDGLRAVGIRTLTALGAHDGVHQLQALESVARIMHFALVDLGQVVLDVAAGQRRTAEHDRKLLGDAPSVHLLGFSFITTVDFTSRPDMPTTSALLSSATSRMVAIGCLMPMLTTS